MPMTREEKIAFLRGQTVAQQDKPMTREDKIAFLRDNSGVTKSYMDALNVKDEQPEWLSWKDRAIVKNFANSPKAQLAYLQNKYPKKMFRLGTDGEVLAMSPEDQQWSKLDPSGISPTEIGKDILDVGYDIPAGALQGAATTAGATAGLAAGGPVGAYAGGALASGGSGAALEAARQGIGKLAGIPQDINMGDVATTGAISAVSPLVFGLGKVGGKPMQGALGYAYDKTLKPVARFLQSKATNIPAEDINYMADNMDTMRGLKESGIMPVAQRVSDQMNSTLENRVTSIGKNLEAGINASGQKVDMTDAKKAFLDRLNFLRSKSDLTHAEAAEAQSLENYFNKYFGLEEPRLVNDVKKGTFGEPVQYLREATDIPDQIPAGRAFDLQKKLKAAAAFETNMTPETLSAKGSARQAHGAINQGLDQATEGLSPELKSEYAQMKTINDEVLPKFGDAQKTYNNTTGLNTKGRQMLKEQLAKLTSNGIIDIGDDINKMNAFKSFYGDAANNLKRQAGLATLGATVGSLAGYQTGAGYSGAAAGGLAGGALGGAIGSPGALAAYLRASGAMNNMSQYVRPYIAPAVNDWFLLKQKQAEEAQQSP